MRIFVAIVGLLLLLSLGSQAVRHAYWRIAATQHSVLERYAEQTEKMILESKSIDELEQHLAETTEKVKVAKASGIEPTKEEFGKPIEEPFKGEYELKRAIEIWEDHQRQIFEVQFFWWCGAMVLATGAFVIGRVEWWLGLSLMILGLTLMTYSTCPPAFGSYRDEFVLLMTYKTAYSVAAVVLLLLSWWHVARLLDQRYRTKERLPQ